MTNGFGESGALRTWKLIRGARTDYGVGLYYAHDRVTASRVRWPSIVRSMPSGFASCSAGGSSAPGVSWYAVMRTNLRIAAVPTDVVPASVVAGYGPPWTIAWQTSTPVG